MAVLVEIGASGSGTGVSESHDSKDGFSFDNERPRHRVWLEPFQLGSRLVTCGEYAGFMNDRGYERPELWLSAGWSTVQAEGWKAPLYWRKTKGEWIVGSLRGNQALANIADAPVTHVSYFEAEAYARWAGESGCQQRRSGRLRLRELQSKETYLRAQILNRRPLRRRQPGACSNFGATVGSGTASAYLGYPRFTPMNGSLGEYNGKFHERTDDFARRQLRDTN